MATIKRSTYASGSAGLAAAIAAASSRGAVLDFEGNTELITTNLSLGPGTYIWRRFVGEKPSGTTGETVITFTGNAYGTPVLLTQNAAIGDKTLQVANGALLRPGALCLLISKAYWHGAYIETLEGAYSRSVKCRRVVIESIVGNTVTLTEPLKSSFSTSDEAGLIQINNGLSIDIEGTFTGAGTGKQQTGFKFLRCDINRLEMSVYDVETRAIWFDQCVFHNEINIHVERSNYSGLGYGIAMGGSYNPMIGPLTGDDVRHLITLTSSSTFTYQGMTVRINGEGGYTTSVHCDDAKGSPFDTHWAWVDHVVLGNITGNWAGSVSQEALTIQAANIQILGTVDLPGFPQGFTLQHFGVPSDETNAIWVNSANFGTTTSVAVMVAESYDSSLLDITVLSLTGSGPQGLVIEDENSGGNITAYFKRVNVTSATSYGLAVNAKQSTGNISVQIDSGSITSNSSNTTHSAVRSFASTQNTPQRAQVALKNMTLTKTGTGYGMRADSGKITINNVAVFSTTYKLITGNGEVVDATTAKKFKRFR